MAGKNHGVIKKNKTFSVLGFLSFFNQQNAATMIFGVHVKQHLSAKI